MGHWAWGIGHGAWGIRKIIYSPLLPLPSTHYPLPILKLLPQPAPALFPQILERGHGIFLRIRLPSRDRCY